MLAEAKVQRKLIFVDVFTDWCGPCKMLDRNVFSDKKVGKQFNSYFINYKTDAKRRGSVIAAQYNVKAYPMGLFINGDGELVHLFTGHMPVTNFMNEGEQALMRTTDGIELALDMNAYEQGNHVRCYLDQS